MSPKAQSLFLPILMILIVSSCKKVDELPPAIVLLEGDFCELALNDTFFDPGARATDNEDGEISSDQIQVNDSEVNTSLIGDYKVYYTLSDKAGNLAERRKSVRVLLKAKNINGSYNVSEFDTAGNLLANFTTSIDSFSDTNSQVHFYALNFNNLGFADSVSMIFSGDYFEIITANDSTSGIIYDFSFGSYDADGSGFDLFYRRRSVSDTLEIVSRFDKL